MWEPLGYQVQAPGEALAGDEALLERVRRGGPGLVRWYTASKTALVLGFAQRVRAADLVDEQALRERGVSLLERRAGGGAVLLDDGMLCLTVALPPDHPLAVDDVTEAYRWLGERLAKGLRSVGAAVRRVDVQEARDDRAHLRASSDPIAALLRAACYGALSPHEVVLGQAKVVGLAQVRRKEGTLFQVGILLRDQSQLADLLRLPDPSLREPFRSALAQRTAGLKALLHEYDHARIAARLEPCVLNGGVGER